ncbi:MAG: 4-(cytidine 5'-diphospho)-2-C-methyl-D-erythritol kinase [Flavisolibacter sp.]
MVSFPNCKINLGLHILGKRPDGFHDLETVFYPVPLTDALEIITAPDQYFQFKQTGLSLDLPSDSNICIKAYELFRQVYPTLPPVKMHLHKTIPSGAGLGGGSADGAFTLLLLNKKYNAGLSEETLLDLALQLGSDCPFFIRNQPALATGRGELLEPIHLDLSGYCIMLVNPGVHINTGWAFSQIKPASGRPSLAGIISKPLETWKNNLVNDFEVPVFEQYEELGIIKKTLYDAGAVYAAMSGSGSTLFGIFPKHDFTPRSFPGHYFTRVI